MMSEEAIISYGYYEENTLRMIEHYFGSKSRNHEEMEYWNIPSLWVTNLITSGGIPHSLLI